MADIVDTLKNSSGDNVFPIAGGMMANSINTNMLKDSSVTSDKIDWTTVPLNNIKSLNDVFQYVGCVMTGAGTSFSFEVEDAAKYCYIIVTTKSRSDGTACGMFFIRKGASKILDIATNISGTRGCSISGNTITVTGGTNYAFNYIYRVGDAA